MLTSPGCDCMQDVQVLVVRDATEFVTGFKRNTKDFSAHGLSEAKVLHDRYLPAQCHACSLVRSCGPWH